MDDFISREEAIRIIQKYNFDFPQYMERFVTELRDAMKADLEHDIRNLPSAQKTGKWKLLHKGEKMSDYECTNCRGIMMDVANDDHHKLQRYCGMCGARMEQEEE